MTDTDKRNACVTCRHCDLGQSDYICMHRAHDVRSWHRVHGESVISRTCNEVRREQPTDACPHWEAK